MCDATSLATMNQMRSALFIANETNKNANEYNEALEGNYRAGLYQIQDQRRQMGAQGSQELSAIARQAEAERARVDVLAGESGMSGNTYERLLTASAQAEQAALAASRTNQENALLQTQREAEQLRSQTQAARKTGVSWEGARLQLEGIELQGRANNANRISAERARQETVKKTSGFGGKGWQYNGKFK